MNYPKLLIFGAGCCLTALPTMALAQTPSAKPNVLFIIMDDMCDWQHYLGGNNQVKTPNLDALSTRGVYFANAYTAVPLSNPSRTAIMTGLQPWVTGIYNNDQQLQDSPVITQSVMMPSLFRNNGYKTFWAGKIFHNKPDQATLESMWDEMDCRDGGYGPWADPLNPTVRVDKEGNGPRWKDIQEWTGPDTDFPDVVNSERLVEFLGEKHDKPFFAAMGFYRPHTPLTAPKRYFDLYDLNDIARPEVLDGDLDDIPAYAVEKFIGNRANEFRSIAANGKLWEQMIRAYLACVSFADDRIGVILNALAKSPYGDNTYIVLVGDNGFHHGEKERFGKSALWREACHVPFMIIPPKGVKDFDRGRCSAPVSLIDIYPTLTALCGLTQAPDEFAGRNISPLLMDVDRSWDEPCVSSYLPGNFVVHCGPWNYIRYADGSQELYNIDRDEAEFNNVVSLSENRDIVKRLNDYLPTEWHQGVKPRSLDRSAGRVVFKSVRGKK